MSKKVKSEFTSHALSILESNSLLKKLDYLKKKNFNLRFQKVSGELTDTSAFAGVKKDIARINTELNKRKTGVKVKNA